MNHLSCSAIAGSTDYDDDMQALLDVDAPGVFEQLATEDIQRAADALRPVYDDSRRADGYVSLEVSPTLAHDTGGTVVEARRLWAAVDRPNLMIKVPATSEGIPSIETLIADPELEAMAARIDQAISYDADRINPPPAARP